MPLIGNVLKPLAKSVLIPLGLTAAASKTDAAIYKEMFGPGTRPSDLASRKSLIISNEEVNDIMKIVKSLALRKKCSYSELFWSVFSRVPTEYGKILPIPYLSVFGPNAGKYGLE